MMTPEAFIRDRETAAGAADVVSDRHQFGQSEAVNLMFVDAAVENIDALISQVARDTQVILLDADSDGIAQITDALSQFEDVASLNVVSHGDAGQIQLGSSTISSTNLAQYSSQLESWQDSLTDSADILFYGCNVAAGENGAQFLSEIDRLTGADIAASTDLTGSNQLGGDWHLEYASGEIETSSPFADDIGQDYGYILQSSRASNGSVFAGQDGKVVIEAESANLKGGWVRTTIANRTAVLYRGNNNLQRADPSQQLEYRFKTDRSGRFSIALHSARQNNLIEKFESHRGNDAFVSIVNAKTGRPVLPTTKLATFFGNANLTYKWGGTFSRNHNLTPAVVNLQGGTEYRFLLTGRSRGYAVDRITLSEGRSFRSLDAPQSRRVPADGGTGGGGNSGGGNSGGGNSGGGNARPTAKFIPRQRATDGSRVNLDLSQFFSDRDGNIASYSARGLPRGLSIDNDGIISGKLSSTASRGDGTNDGSRTYSVNVRATDNDGASVNKSFRYTVNDGDPVVQPPSPQPNPGSSFRIEAESLSLKGYRVESNSFASKGRLISLRGGKTGETGSATYVHRRQAGTFDIDLRYFDENDGVSTMTVKLNGKQIDRWRFNARTNGSNISAGTSKIRKLRGITLKAGDRLEIVGAEGQREHARLDYLNFKPVASR